MSIEVKFRSAGLCAGSTYVIQGPGVADWSDIENGPASSPEDIDAAVAAAHTHTNSAMLAKIGESAGEPTYDGEQLAKTSALTTKADLVAGKVPADQLPSYVDDVLEYANAAAFPASGSSGVIYIAVATEKAYRWTGSTYVEISQPPASSDAVPEGSSNLYYTQARADARAEAAVAVHVGQSDPHTQYLTTSRGDARYDALGAAADAQAACPAETATTIGALISGATAKTAPADADTLGLSDSAASNVLKKLTWANAKATLKTYFDSLYQAAGSYITSGGALGTPASGNLSNCSGAVDARIPTSGNTAGNVPAFTSTGGQLGASPISVAGSSIVINSDGNAAFVFRGITNPNNNIYVGYDSAGNYGRIQAITEGTALRPLALNPDGGNVGIGPTAPAEKLHVSGAVKVVGGYGNGNAWDGSVTIGGAGSGSADLGSISWGDGTGYKLHLGPKPGNGAFTPKFTFTDTGSLSIGTAGLPSYNGTLQVYGPSSFDGSGGGVNSLLNGFSSSAAGAGVGASFVLGGKTGNAVDLYAFGALKAYKKTGGADGSYAGKLGLFTTDQYGTVAERITVDDAGNVGIGTTSPGAKLHIESANVQPSLRIEDSRLLAQGLGGELYLAGRYGSSRGSGEGVYTRIAAYKENATNEDYAYAMTFSTHPYPGSLTEGMRISSAGLVGIGTTAPTDLLDVNSDAMRLRSSKTPASASAAGNAGEMCWDASYLYVCVATNTWRRVAHSSW